MLKRFGLVFICALNLSLLVSFVFCLAVQNRKFSVCVRRKSALLPPRFASGRKFAYLRSAKSAKQLNFA